MPKGSRRTSYVRDGRGRFASTPGGGAPKRPPAKRASRGTNRLTRDNSGRITSVGGNGATARGGRLRTGAGNLRARQTDRLKGAPQGVLSRGGKARGKVAAAKAAPPKPTAPKRVTATRQRVKPPVGTPRKGQVARALARAQANMQRAIAAVDKAQGRNKRNISRASAEAGILQLSKPGSAEARKAKAAYDRLEKKIKKGEKTRTAAANAKQRFRALERAMTRGYGPTIARAKVRAGGNRSLLEPAPGDRIKGGRQGGTIAKPRGMKPGALAAKRQKPAGKQKKPLTKERISAAKGKITAKLTAVLDEIRKVENAKNRDNTPASSGFSPRYLKLIARGQKADKQLESLRRASKRLKQIELSYDPAKYGYGRGTDQRKSLATEIRNARKQLTTLQREEATAKKVYEADPVVKFGLWGEIGQNRKQSRKAKERRSNASMNRADRYIGARIAIRQQQNAIKQLRDKAKQQTQETNKRQKPRKP